MTRRHLLVTAAAALGIPAVAPEAALPTAVRFGPVYDGLPVIHYRIEVRALTGAFMGFEGRDRAGLDRARACAERLYPMSEGHQHSEDITFGSAKPFTFLARVPKQS